MRRSQWPSVARQLFAETPDPELLERYILHREDDAFAQLMHRYSRLVWSLCRNLLSGDADADDAFQATFLTLARSAGRLKAEVPLGPWLHGVAFRVCKHARRAGGRRAQHERAHARAEAIHPVPDSSWETAFSIATEEVQRLPEAERVAFVLCYLEGRSASEAATALGVRPGTLATRLTRAKQKLMARLAKRGLVAGVLALSGVSGAVAVAPATLIERTLALLPSGVTIPSSIQSLMQGVTGMAMIRFKVLAAGVLIATGFGLSVGGWYGSATAQTATQPPIPLAGDAKLEELKKQVAKAQAELTKAERERVLMIEMSLALETALSNRYEYEAIPKDGLTAKEFEAKLALREKAGWTFLGHVPIKSEKGTASTLVFREKPKQAVRRGDVIFDYEPTPEEQPLLPRGSTIVPAVDIFPTSPGTPKKPTPESPMPPPPKPVVVPDGGSVLLGGVKNLEEGRSEVGPGQPPSGLPSTGGQRQYSIESLQTKAESEIRTNIAILEKQLQELRGAKGEINYNLSVAKPLGVNVLTRAEFGNWDPVVLAEVLKKIMADIPKDDARFKIQAIPARRDPKVDAELQIQGSLRDVAMASDWVKKLKK